MENKEDIGRVFSKKLSSLEKSPNEKVWSAISYELQKKKKRRGIFFFFSTKTIGLFLLGIMTLGYLYFQNSDYNPFSEPTSNETVPLKESNNSSINSKESTQKEVQSNEVNSNSENHKTVVENATAIETEGSSDNKSVSEKTNNTNNYRKKTERANEKNNLFTTDNSQSRKSKAKQLAGLHLKNTKTKHQKNKIKKEKTAQSATDDNVIDNQNTTSATSLDLNSLQNKDIAIKEKEAPVKKKDSLASKKEKDKTMTILMHKIEEDSTKTFRKFEVDVFASPVYYGYFSKSSTIDKRLDSVSKSSAIQLSYGAGLTYELTDKYSIRIGYSQVKMRFTTADAPVNISNYRGISYKSGVTNQTIYAASNGAETMDITQNISYSEIPLEIKYRFMNKKFGLQAIFGFSYALLGENTVTIATSNGFRQDIGRTKNILDTAISTNVGVGLDYEIFKNTKLILEPMFNYQVMSFEDSNYKPFYFGIHTGIRYTFLNK